MVSELTQVKEQIKALLKVYNGPPIADLTVYTQMDIDLDRLVARRKEIENQKPADSDTNDFKRLLASNGFSNAQVARYLEVSQQSIGNWLSGRVKTPAMVLKLLSSRQILLKHNLL